MRSDVTGGDLRAAREAKGISLRVLAGLIGKDPGHLSRVERSVDDRDVTPALIDLYERVLRVTITPSTLDHDATTSTSAATTQPSPSGTVQTGSPNAGPPSPGADRDGDKEDNVRRRHLIQALTGLAMAAPPLMRLEALRRGLGYAVGSDRAQWDAVVTDYANDFYTTPHTDLRDQLAVDIGIVQQLLVISPQDRDLHRAAAYLAMILAITLTSTGQFWPARRWWHSAHEHADTSGDLEVRVMTRSQQAVKALYIGHPLPDVLALTDQTVALAGDRVSAGLAGVIAGRAQTLAIMGRRDEAIDAVRTVEQMTAQMPTATVTDESMFGWPEHRLWHTTSFVHTEVGDTRSAMTAQDRALDLYSINHAMNGAMVQMHRASCLIQDGDITGGVRHVADVLDALPVEHHNALVYDVARRALSAVPDRERGRAEFSDVRYRVLALPSRTS
jgi:hypothetical protein